MMKAAKVEHVAHSWQGSQLILQSDLGDVIAARMIQGNSVCASQRYLRIPQIKILCYSHWTPLGSLDRERILHRKLECFAVGNLQLLVGGRTGCYRRKSAIETRSKESVYLIQSSPRSPMFWSELLLMLVGFL